MALNVAFDDAPCVCVCVTKLLNRRDVLVSVLMHAISLVYIVRSTRYDTMCVHVCIKTRFLFFFSFLNQAIVEVHDTEPQIYIIR